MKTVRNILLLLLLLPCCHSCIKEQTELPDVPSTEGGQIILNFASKAATRASADVENRITSLDLFVFLEDESADKTCQYYNRFTPSGTSLTLAKSRFEAQTQYKAYLLANCTLPQDNFKPSTDGGADITLSDLQAMIQTDPLIYQTGAQGAPQAFLMDGVVKTQANDGGLPSFVLNDVDNETDINLHALLCRAAAKISVTLTAADDVFFISSLDSKPTDAEGTLEDGANVLSTYTIRQMRADTKLLSGTDLPTSGLISTETPVNIQSNDGTTEASTLRKLETYVYSHNWEKGGDDVSTETYIAVQIPIWYKTTDETTGETKWEPRTNNYYKVPIYTPGANGEKLLRIDRNTHYDISFKVSKPGAESIYKPEELKDGQYQVEPWQTTTIEVGGDGQGKPQYLEVNKEKLVLRNVAEDRTIEFASSSNVTARVVRVYYTNKFGEDVDIDENEWERSLGIRVTGGTGMNGTLTLHSNVPENNLKRCIVLEIINENGGKKTIVVEQYPLEYITHLKGYYSYRKDFHRDGETPNHYENRGSGYAYAVYSGTTLSINSGNLPRSYLFVSKVAKWNGNSVNQNIYNCYGSGSDNGWNTTSRNGTFTNPRIYHVQLTSSSEDYTLGIPRVGDNGITDPSSENAKLVSPSFMIASQLGGLQGTLPNLEAAALHCANYMETYHADDGTTKLLDNWRIPTKSELKIITDFQRDSEAIDEILTADAYFCASGGVYTDPKNTNEPPSRDLRVRCVRDVY